MSGDAWDEVHETAARLWLEAEAGDSRQLNAWLEADARHRAVYDGMVRMLAQIDANEGTVSLLQLRRQALSDALENGRYFRSRTLPRRGLVAGLVAAVAAPTAWLLMKDGGQSYRTGIGEQRRVTLADGSTMTLDANSSAIVAYAQGKRRVELESGRALFSVAKDSTRPFIVASGSRTVTATGTIFSVENRDRQWSVLLVQGGVVVRAAAFAKVLRPNQRAVVTSEGRLPQITEADAGRGTAWRDGILDFDDAPLAEVAARLNDYSSTKITVRGAASSLRISGTFVAGRSADFVQTVSEYYPVAVRKALDGFVLEQISERPRT